MASDQQNEGLQAKLVIDRDTASRLGITPQMIDDTLYDAFGQRQVSTMFTQLNQYHVVLEVIAELQQKPAISMQIYITIGARRRGAAAARSRTMSRSNAPLAMNHQGQFPAVTVSFNLAPGASLGEAVKAINAAKAEIGMPPSIADRISGHGAGVSGVAGE